MRSKFWVQHDRVRNGLLWGFVHHAEYDSITICTHERGVIKVVAARQKVLQQLGWELIFSPVIGDVPQSDGALVLAAAAHGQH
jgi:hypothetical protein